jgi:hypothetical protein
MFKLSNIGERLYNCIDNFFQGTVKHEVDNNAIGLSTFNSLKYNYIEWELHQDYIDIIIFDLKASFSWIIPGFLRKFGSKVQQWCLVYLFTDMALEEIYATTYSLPSIPAQGKKAVILYPKVIKDMISAKCSCTCNWLYESYKKSKLIITFELLRKPYYLLGNFAPYRYDVPVKETSFIMKELKSVKLNPAFAYHKRN